MVNILILGGRDGGKGLQTWDTHCIVEVRGRGNLKNVS